jgi:hypothetical protein
MFSLSPDFGHIHPSDDTSDVFIPLEDGPWVFGAMEVPHLEVILGRVISSWLRLESELTALVVVRSLGFIGNQGQRNDKPWSNPWAHPCCCCKGLTEKAPWLMVILSRDKLFEFKMNYALKQLRFWSIKRSRMIIVSSI